MSFLVYIIFGGIVGWVASLIMGTDGQQGIILNIVVGIIGAVLGNWIFGFFGQSGVGGFTLYSFIVALIGAVAFIGILRAIRG
ncbi:MAG: GlsB/YeaQ/YmgE family stress response membrane protein [Candidatus Moraniibacteriota bacterium]|nr:MAG: GlsB/YeaQ/YmgE family stress response membrane protein [Candidatus Moranbacteria bacterium]